MSESRTVEFGNGVRLELLTGEYGFAGIGEVTVNGIRLRDGSRPIHLRLDTPDGILYTRLELLEVEATPARAVVKLRAWGQPWGQQAYMDDYAQPLVNIELPVEPVADTVELLLDAVDETLGSDTFAGFSYAWRFASPARQVCRMVTESTWEIGGTVDGNTVLHQGQCNAPAWAGGKDSLFTTACLKTLSGYGSPQGYSFQLCPRPGPLQGFDFQYSREGVLLQYWPDFESVCSLIESPVGSDRLHVLDEQRFELTSEVTAPPKRVLFLAGERPEHECRDLWYLALERIYGDLRERFGVAPTIVLPEQNHGYRTRVEDGKLFIILHDQEFPSHQFLHGLADLVLPELARQGVKRFFPSVVSASDVTEYGMRRKLDAGIHGDLHCASVCATHCFFPSEFWGGIEGWKYMYEKGKSLGLEIGAWFAPHYSPRAAIWQEHPDWAMIDATSARAGGGYGFHTLNVGDWNTGLYDWTLENLKAWKEQGGLDFLFVDSYSNLGLLQQNYAHQMRTNFRRLSSLFADIQKLGIGGFCFESVAAFGYGHFGLTDLQGRYLDQDKAVAGQNDFAWWVGEEDMAVDVSTMVVSHERSAEEQAQILFRFMANRGYIVYQNGIDERHQMPGWYVDSNHLYNQVVEDMHVRRLLPDKAGVEWLGNDRRVIWSFVPQALELADDEPICRVTPTGPEPLGNGGTHQLEPYAVYRVG